MTTAPGYREFADECLGWARTAESDRERRIFLQMGEAWLEVAARLEARDRNDEQRQLLLDMARTWRLTGLRRLPNNSEWHRTR